MRTKPRMYICDGAGVLPVGSSEWEGGKGRGGEAVETIEGGKKEGKRKSNYDLPALYTHYCMSYTHDLAARASPSLVFAVLMIRFLA